MGYNDQEINEILSLLLERLSPEILSNYIQKVNDNTLYNIQNNQEMIQLQDNSQFTMFCRIVFNIQYGQKMGRGQLLSCLIFNNCIKYKNLNDLNYNNQIIEIKTVTGRIKGDNTFGSLQSVLLNIFQNIKSLINDTNNNIKKYWLY